MEVRIPGGNHLDENLRGGNGNDQLSEHINNRSEGVLATVLRN